MEKQKTGRAVVTDFVSLDPVAVDEFRKVESGAIYTETQGEL